MSTEEIYLKKRQYSVLENDEFRSLSNNSIHISKSNLKFQSQNLDSEEKTISIPYYDQDIIKESNNEVIFSSSKYSTEDKPNKNETEHQHKKCESYSKNCKLSKLTLKYDILLSENKSLKKNINKLENIIDGPNFSNNIISDSLCFFNSLINIYKKLTTNISNTKHADYHNLDNLQNEFSNKNNLSSSEQIQIMSKMTYKVAISILILLKIFIAGFSILLIFYLPFIYEEIFTIIFIITIILVLHFSTKLLNIGFNKKNLSIRSEKITLIERSNNVVFIFFTINFVMISLFTIQFIINIWNSVQSIITFFLDDYSQYFQIQNFYDNDFCRNENNKFIYKINVSSMNKNDSNNNPFYVVYFYGIIVNKLSYFLGLLNNFGNSSCFIYLYILINYIILRIVNNDEIKIIIKYLMLKSQIILIEKRNLKVVDFYKKIAFYINDKIIYLNKKFLNLFFFIANEILPRYEFFTFCLFIINSILSINHKKTSFVSEIFYISFSNLMIFIEKQNKSNCLGKFTIKDEYYYNDVKNQELNNLIENNKDSRNHKTNKIDSLISKNKVSHHRKIKESKIKLINENKIKLIICKEIDQIFINNVKIEINEFKDNNDPDLIQTQNLKLIKKNFKYIENTSKVFNSYIIMKRNQSMEMSNESYIESAPLINKYAEFYNFLVFYLKINLSDFFKDVSIQQEFDFINYEKIQEILNLFLSATKNNFEEKYKNFLNKILIFSKVYLFVKE